MESSQSAGPRLFLLVESFIEEKGATGIFGVVLCGIPACRSRERKERGSVGSEFGDPTVVICLFKRLPFPFFRFFAFLTPIFSMMTPECLLNGKGISFSRRASSS